MAGAGLAASTPSRSP